MLFVDPRGPLMGLRMLPVGGFLQGSGEYVW